MSARVTLCLSSRTLFARPISLSHAARLKRLTDDTVDRIRTTAADRDKKQTALMSSTYS
jgi:hypothetical protein